MAFEENILEFIVYQFGGRVVVALYLVADDLNLLVNLCLRVLAMEYDVGQQVYGTVQVVAMDGGIEGGVFLVRKGIQFTPYLRRSVPLKVTCSQKCASPSSPCNSLRVPAAIW